MMVVMSFFSEVTFPSLGLRLLLAFSDLRLFNFPILIFIIYINIAAFRAVKNDRPVVGIIFSILLGSIGGFIATRTENENYNKTKVINIIFNIHMWIIIWSIISLVPFFIWIWS